MDSYKNNEIKNHIQDIPPNKIARIAGCFYLIFIVTLVLSSAIRSKLIVFGDAAVTANNILSSQGLFLSGFMSEILSAVFFNLAAWALYVLLKPVNKNYALLFLLLNLGGVIVEIINMLNLYTPLLLLSGADYLNVFQADQLQALAMVFFYSYSKGFLIAQIFFSTWLLPLGYLLYKSRFVPRFLGILVIMDFFGVLIWFLQSFLLPGYAILTYPGLAVSFTAEVGISLWLLIKGVKNPEPPLVGVN